MKYKIRVDYSTGDSYGSRDTSDFIELEWDNLDIAKENLRRIKEHYEFYRQENSYTRRYNKDAKDYSDRPWFVNVPKPWLISSDRRIDEKDVKKFPGDVEYRPDPYFSQHCIKLIADNGNEMQMSCFWCGYFEHLIGAEIVPDDTGMKFEL